MEKQSYARAKYLIEEIDYLNKVLLFVNHPDWYRLSFTFLSGKDHVIIPKDCIDEELLIILAESIKEKVKSTIEDDERRFKAL